MKSVNVNLPRLIAVAIVGGIVMAVGEPFVADAYRRAFFMACGGVLGITTVVLAVRPKPDIQLKGTPATHGSSSQKSWSEW